MHAAKKKNTKTPSDVIAGEGNLMVGVWVAQRPGKGGRYLGFKIGVSWWMEVT